jgi:hypothetical protein
MSTLENKFIRPCEAIKILGISRETLRRNYQKMQIRRTLEKPYFYSKSDCLVWASKRYEMPELQDNSYWEKRKKDF